MDVQITPYKLIPVKVFEDLMAKNNDDSNNKYNNNNNNNNNNINNNMTNKRSIKEIQDLAISKIMDENTNSLEIPSVEQQLKENVKTYGEGAKTKNNLAWLYQDDTKLPQFSTQSKIESSLDDYLNILNSKDIPNDMKVKLATFYKQKYDRSRKPDVFKDDDYYDDEDENFDDINIGNTALATYSGPELAVAIILSKTNVTKIPLIKKLSTELMKHTKYINWNYKGIITHPEQYRNTQHINLGRMLNIMVSKTEKATPTEFAIITNIIRPFYLDIKSHIKNSEIQKHFKDLDIYQGLTASGRTTKSISTATPRASSNKKKRTKSFNPYSPNNTLTYETL